MMSKVWKWVLAGVAVAVLSGCGGGGAPADIPNSILSDEKEIENIKLSDGREVQAVKNEVLVYLDEDVTKEEYDNIVTKCKGYGEIKGFDIELRTMLVKVKDSVSEVEMIKEIKKLSGVWSASVNELLNFGNTENTNIKYPFIPQKKKKMSYGSVKSFDGDYWMADIKIQDAWKVEDSIGSRAKVTVGIVDTGIPKGQDVISESRLSRYDTSGKSIDDDDSFDAESGDH